MAAATLALAGLLFADPAFPAKRVHVFQYALLALVVRRGLASRLDGVPLMAMSALVAALLGVHDELIQGLRPERYFSLTDILVNTVSASAGGCLGTALWGPGNRDDPPSPRAWLAVGLALAVLLSGLTYAPAARHYQCGLGCQHRSALPLGCCRCQQGIVGLAPCRCGLPAARLLSRPLQTWLTCLSPRALYLPYAVK
ncbi:MAG: VanZ family protein [Alphaproteobacteria bacterium]|nr:VanZ family protein [Alphaproteobacteria bacterium]